MLPGGFKTKLVETAERGEVRANEGSVQQVEVSRMASVRTSIIGRPRLYPVTEARPGCTPTPLSPTKRP